MMPINSAQDFAINGAGQRLATRYTQVDLTLTIESLHAPGQVFFQGPGWLITDFESRQWAAHLIGNALST